MKKTILIAAMLAMTPVAAFAQAPYSTTTTEIGTLLDNPETKAIIEKHIPGMTTNDQVEMARAMTLKDIQQYSPEAITDKVLAAIDADLAKVKQTK
jgi:para-nitrobenzyl esterase